MHTLPSVAAWPVGLEGLLGGGELVEALRGTCVAGQPTHGYLLAKRAVDILFAAALLVLVMPLLLLVALAIRLDSRGPILYRQQRVGQYGTTIEMLKFRTMRADRRQRPATVGFQERRVRLKTDRDPRVTRLGGFLRKSSLDELPQLFSVLRGDMTLVGPRPEQMEMLKYYRPETYRRHLATPGLTGWWQTHGRSERGRDFTPEEDLRLKVRDDVFYLEHRSFLLDLQVLLLTIPVVLTRRGAY